MSVPVDPQNVTQNVTHSITQNVTQLLEDEIEEEEHFQQQTHQHLFPDTGNGMRHSATTDTLDSVYLDPPTLEQDLESELLTDEQNAGLMPSTTEQRLDAQTTEQQCIMAIDPIQDSQTATENTEEKISDTDSPHTEAVTSTNEDIFFSIDGKEEAVASPISPLSLSKYFGKEASPDDPFETNIFDTIGEIETSNKVAADNVQVIDVAKGMDGDYVKQEEIVNEMTDLTLDDSKDFFDEVNDGSSKDDNINNNRDIRKSEDFNVDFDLGLENNDPGEKPVDIEEKDDFETFTAYAADSEALDALGMSPAAPSFMTETNITEYFRQTSQAESVHSLGIGRQLSHSSGRSNQDTGAAAETLEDVLDNGSFQPVSIPPHVDKSESSLPTPDMSQHTSLIKEAESRGSESVESTPTHHLMFPPSTTLSPVDSPVHQPLFNNTAEHRASIRNVPVSPEHRVMAFQNGTDASEDIFSASLQMSDSDRQHDAWLPSEATKNILIDMATQGTSIPDTELLCSPSLVITDSQGDPVRDLVYRYMGEQEALKRQVLTANKVTQNADGLKKLMSHGCYRSAIDLSGSLLADVGQAEQGETPTHHTPDTLQLWHCRFSLMMKLRMYNVLESECAAFKNLDTPDIYYEFYPKLFPGKRGSMVSFGMRLLHAELPHHSGRSQESLDRLYYLLAITKKILKNLDEGLAEDGSTVTISAESRKVSQDLWMERERRVLYVVGNILVSLRDYDAALSIYEILLENDKPHRTALLSGLGRIHLQIGNVGKAVEYFQLVQSANDMDTATANTTLYMNKGFEAMCQNNFNDAYQSFKRAVDADASNTSAVNNMAVCCLYLGRLNDALKSLEALVHADPDKNLHEGILFNLCTLYELESSRSLHKKQALLDLVSKHKGDGFPVVCLKMA